MTDESARYAGIVAAGMIPKRDGAEGAPTPTTPRHRNPVEEGLTMPCYRQYGDSAPERNQNISEHSTNPAALLRKCERAMSDGLFEVAETYHAQFVEASIK